MWAGLAFWWFIYYTAFLALVHGAGCELWALDIYKQLSPYPQQHHFYCNVLCKDETLECELQTPVANPVGSAMFP